MTAATPARLFALAALCLASLAAPALAQDFPSRPITIVVPYSPGGPSDQMARTVAQSLTRRLGQNVVIDNRAGGGGTPALTYLANARPDGYTIALASLSQLASIKYLRTTPLQYDPVKSFEPLSFTGHGAPIWLVSRASLNLRSVDDFIRYAKANPGKVNYGSDGVGTLTHVPMVQLAREAGFTATHVPYKGSSFVVQALLSGEIDVAFSGLPTALEHIKAGKINVLATASETPGTPDTTVKTVAQQGFAGFAYRSWWGFIAPAGTPPDVVQKLSAALVAVAADPAVRPQLEAQGYEVVGSDARAFRDLIVRENERWAQLAKVLDIRVAE